jgi:hypothetical protein
LKRESIEAKECFRQWEKLSSGDDGGRVGSMVSGQENGEGQISFSGVDMVAFKLYCAMEFGVQNQLRA